MIKLNLACGKIILPGWINLDKNPASPEVIACDLTNQLPYANNSVDEIFTSHFLEHLKLRTEAIPFLQECNRILKPSGILSIITPDFEMIPRIKWFDLHFNKLRNREQQLRWLVGATFGEGRTDWDYHVSGWFRKRYEEMGKGTIVVDPAAGELIAIWDDMTLIKIITDWRPHSPYEITAIYRKTGGIYNQPSWLEQPEIVGTGFVSPTKFIAKHLAIAALSPIYCFVKGKSLL
jgi:SAM-dependent methyltransferase